MRAEDQTMLVEEGQGQQTVQCLFVQPNKKRQRTRVLSIEFSVNPEDGLYCYVFSGTFDQFLSFKQLMEQEGVFPAHELPGSAKATPETDEPVIQTDPVKTDQDTLSEPAEIIPDEGEDNEVQHPEPTPETTDSSSELGEAGAKPESDNADGGQSIQPEGGKTGGKAKSGNTSRTERSKVKAEAKTEGADIFDL